MTLSYLLDTSIISSPVSKTPNPEIVRRVSQHAQACAIGSPVWHEIVFGCRRLPRSQRRAALEAYLEDVVHASFRILPYDEAAAAWHAAERARLEALGEPAPYVDGQIAAIAQTNGLILVTANAKDFLRFKALRVENWSKRQAAHSQSP